MIDSVQLRRRVLFRLKNWKNPSVIPKYVCACNICHFARHFLGRLHMRLGPPLYWYAVQTWNEALCCLDSRVLVRDVVSVSRAETVSRPTFQTSRTRLDIRLLSRLGKEIKCSPSVPNTIWGLVWHAPCIGSQTRWNRRLETIRVDFRFQISGWISEVDFGRNRVAGRSSLLRKNLPFDFWIEKAHFYPIYNLKFRATIRNSWIGHWKRRVI